MSIIFLSLYRIAQSQRKHLTHRISRISLGVIEINLSFEALLLTTALSLDAFAASFAYGSSKIKIPFKSVMVINIIGSLVLASSIYLGALLRPFIPAEIASGLAFVILFTLGLIKIFDAAFKSLIRKYSDAYKKVEFSLLDFKFILTVYANPERADVDSSRALSPKEAVVIAAALSLDSFAVGFGAGLISINHFQIIAFSLVTDVVAIVLGCRLGNKIAEKSPVNMSWLGGIILILIAFF